MKRYLWMFLLVFAGCGSTAVESVEPAPTVAEQPPSIPVPTPAGSCALRAETAAAPILPPALMAVAPQYFHPAHRGGFDAYVGGPPRFPWFDVFDLARPLTPPTGVRVAASTRSTLFVVRSRSGELGLMPRAGGPPTWTGERLYPVEAVEVEPAARFALVRSGSGYRVVHFDAAGAARVEALALPETFHDRRIALTADGKLALAWLEREGGRLRILLRIGDAAPVAVDEVSLPEPVAALAERTSVSLAIAAHGAHGVGLAWRPLVDRDYTDVGSASEPPTTQARAEVRWLAVEPGRPAPDPSTYPAVAYPLAGTTGIGPWGLTSNGMKGATLDGHAIFVWLDAEGIRGAAAGSEAVLLAPRDAAPLLTFRSREDRLELLAFDSSPQVQAFTLSCAP